MKKFAVSFIDFGKDSDEFPNTHEELFDAYEIAKSFIEWDVNNLNEFRDNENPLSIIWKNKDDAIVSSKNGDEISKYRICEIDIDNHTYLPF